MIKGMYSKLPQHIKINNERLFINTDFRIFIQFEKEILEGNTKQATMNVLESFSPDFFKTNRSEEEMQQYIDKFIWFYHCGKEENTTNKQEGKTQSSPIFNYEYDSDLIWGAYWQFAKIDLTKDYVHWWRFKAIWNCLPSDCEFSKIKGYRAYSGKDKDMLELKETYKLPPTKAEIEKELKAEKIYEMFK